MRVVLLVVDRAAVRCGGTAVALSRVHAECCGLAAHALAPVCGRLGAPRALSLPTGGVESALVFCASLCWWTMVEVRFAL